MVVSVVRHVHITLRRTTKKIIYMLCYDYDIYTLPNSGHALILKQMVGENPW